MTETDKALDGSWQNLDRKFEAIDKRFDEIDKRLDEIAIGAEYCFKFFCHDMIKLLLKSRNSRFHFLRCENTLMILKN